MQENQPAISLVIATYNRGSAIGRTIDSALKQTQPIQEILVVDDSSTDETGGWITRNYPQVRVERTPRNLFTSGARNFGARCASGAWLMFLDHDDELLPHAVETLRAELQAFPEAGAAFADHEYRDIKREIQFTDHHVSQRAFHRLRGVTAERISPQGRLYSTNLYSALLSGNLLQQPWMIRRELFLTLDGFDESIKYCEDWEMYLRVTRDASVVLHDEVISIHWVEGDNLHLSPDQTDMQLRVLQKRLMKERISNPRLAWIVRKRIAQLFKFQGDCLSVQDLESAWHSYFQSAAHWPYDFVVFLRLAWWTTKLGARNFRKYLGCAKDSCLTQ